MIGDLAKRLIIDDDINRRLNPRILVDRTKTSRLPNEMKGDFDPSFLYTFGFYSIEYRPIKNFNSNRDKPYLLNCDFFPKKVLRLKGWYEIEENQDIPNLELLLRITTITPKLFEIAENNPYVKIPFTLKVEEIYDILKAKSDMQGLLSDCENRMLLEQHRRKEQERVRKAKGAIDKWLNE